VLVGENGSGKSTVLEVLAAALGLNAEGGSVGTRLRTRPGEPGSLDLIVEHSPRADRWAYFLRDETMHGLYSYLEAHPPRCGDEPVFHELSHGEAFLALLGRRASAGGLYLLDEPDAALSFTGTLARRAAGRARRRRRTGGDRHALARAGRTPRGDLAGSRRPGPAGRPVGRPRAHGELAPVPGGSAVVPPAPDLTRAAAHIAVVTDVVNRWVPA
jgi:hypothetical protein